MKTRIRWAPAEDVVLRERYPTTTAGLIAQQLDRPISAIYQRAATLGLSKAPGVVAQVARERSLDPNHGGRMFRFGVNGYAWNKGIRGSTGLHENTRRNWFRSGQLNGKAAQHVLPLGAHRINGEGYLERKISEESGPPGKRWQRVHALVWMEANGPIPAGHIVVFKPGRHSTDIERITLDALELVTRAELMRRNSVHAKYGPEVARLVQLRGAVTRQINRKLKEQA